MPAVGRQKISPVDAGAGRRKQVRQPLPYQPAEIQRIPGNPCLLADALQPLQARVDLLQALLQGFRRQQRPNLTVQVLGRKENRQVGRQVVEHVRHERLEVLHADALEQPALPQAVLDQLAAGDQGVRIGGLQGNVDRHLILHGMVQQQVGGIGDDGVRLRKRTDDVGIDFKPVQSPAEQTGRGQKGQYQESPVQGQPFHMRFTCRPSAPARP